MHGVVCDTRVWWCCLSLLLGACTVYLYPHRMHANAHTNPWELLQANTWNFHNELVCNVYRSLVKTVICIVVWFWLMCCARIWRLFMVMLELLLLHCASWVQHVVLIFYIDTRCCRVHGRFFSTKHSAVDRLLCNSSFCIMSQQLYWSYLHADICSRSLTNSEWHTLRV